MQLIVLHPKTNNLNERINGRVVIVSEDIRGRILNRFLGHREPLTDGEADTINEWIQSGRYQVTKIIYEITN